METGREVQAMRGDVAAYLGVVGVSASTFGDWSRAYAAGTLVPSSEPAITAEERRTREELRVRMMDLAHRRHYTFGLDPLWIEYRGRVTREVFRELAREVRREVNRERRNRLQRYEFLHPDVAHSLDFVQLPSEEVNRAKRYLIRILDECTRKTLRHAITPFKGAGVGWQFVRDHLRAGLLPFVFKYDREFDVPQFEGELTGRRIVPLPSPPRYPQFNGKNERANRDVQQWLDAFGEGQFWGYDELQKEMDFCFTQLDEVEERAMFGGKTRSNAYERMPRATVDREPFFRDASEFRSHLLRRPDNRLSPTDAWRVAAKEALKKYGLVRYTGPSEV